MRTKKDKRLELFENDHAFIYKGKEYKYNYMLFKKMSNYMKMNKYIFKNNKTTILLDENIKIDLSEDSINAFINFCQLDDYKHLMNDSNIIQIYYLAHYYEVDQLVKKAKKYLTKNSHKMALDILLLQNDMNDFEKPLYEEIISAKLEFFINDKKILNLNIPTIHRILTDHNKKYKSNDENLNDQIIELKFKYLDKYGFGASVLFENVDFEKEKKI